MRAYHRAPDTCSRRECLLDLLPGVKASRRRRACTTPQAISTALTVEDELWQPPAMHVSPLHPPSSISVQLPDHPQPQAWTPAAVSHEVSNTSGGQSQQGEPQRVAAATSSTGHHAVHRKARGLDLTQVWQPPTAAPGFLTRQITSAASCGELLDLVQRHQQHLNVIHLTAALSRTAKLFKLPGLTPLDARIANSQLVPLLIDALRNQQQLLSARCIGSALHALACLDVRDRELYMELCGLAERRMQEFTSQGLANMLWAFAQSAWPPPPRWMEQFLGVLHSKLHSFSYQDVALIMWGLAKLKYRLSAVRQQEMVDAAKARLGRCSPQALTMIAYSLASAGQHPGTEWLSLFEASMLRRPGLHKFTPHGLSTTLWSLASLGHQPSPQLAAALCQHLTDATLRKFKGIDVSTTLHALARMHMQLSAPAHMALRKRLHACLGDLEPMQLANAGLAVAQLQLLHPTHPTVEQRTFIKLLTVAYNKRMMFNTHDLSMLVQALARLRCQLPASFIMALQQRIEQVGMEFTPQDIALTLWGLQRLGAAPSPDLMAVFFEATGQRLSSFKPQELAIMIWALAQARYQPNKQWTAEFLHCTFPRLKEFAPQGLAHVIMALAQLSIKPTPAWLVAFVNSAAPMLPDCKRQDILEIMHGLQCFITPPDGYQLAKLDEFLQQAQAALAAMPAAKSSPAQAAMEAAERRHTFDDVLGAPSQAVPLSLHHTTPDAAPMNGHHAAAAVAGVAAGAGVASLGSGQAQAALSSSKKQRQGHGDRRRSTKGASSKQHAGPTTVDATAHHPLADSHNLQHSNGAQKLEHAAVGEPVGAESHVMIAVAGAHGGHKGPQRTRKQHKAAAVKVAKAAEAGLVGQQQAHLLVHSHDLHTASAVS